MSGQPYGGPGRMPGSPRVGTGPMPGQPYGGTGVQPNPMNGPGPARTATAAWGSPTGTIAGPGTTRMPPWEQLDEPGRRGFESPVDDPFWEPIDDRGRGRGRGRRAADDDMDQPAGSAAEHHAGNRLFVLVLFWFAMAASVAAWWFNNADNSIKTTADIMTAIGRITGMVGGYILIIQVLMMSRIAWLESWLGSHDLLRWHRPMGGYLFVMVIGHVVFTIYGYAKLQQVSFTKETWTMITTYEDMISATIATGLLIALSLLGIRAIRRAMSYELWYLIHLTSYLVLLLSYGHQYAVGTELTKPGVQWFWSALYALVIVCLAWGRIIEPLWLNARHRLRVLEVVPESADMYSIYVGGRHLDEMDVQAGQYFRWRFLNGGGWWQSHPFSLSAAPNRQALRLTICEAGDHTTALRRLRPGTRVIVEGPSGTFTADRRKTSAPLLIAAGSGIAPIRALMEDMPPGTMVIYRARNQAELVFRAELERLAAERQIRVLFVLGSRNDRGPRQLLHPAGVREMVPRLTQRDVYLCGPPALISLMVKTLRRAGVPQSKIHLDPFEF